VTNPSRSDAKGAKNKLMDDKRDGQQPGSGASGSKKKGEIWGCHRRRRTSDKPTGAYLRYQKKLGTSWGKGEGKSYLDKAAVGAPGSRTERGSGREGGALANRSPWTSRYRRKKGGSKEREGIYKLQPARNKLLNGETHISRKKRMRVKAIDGPRKGAGGAGGETGGTALIAGRKGSCARSKERKEDKKSRGPDTTPTQGVLGSPGRLEACKGQRRVKEEKSLRPNILGALEMPQC